MKAIEVEKIISDNGWYLVKRVGSHKQYRHHSKLGKVTIPYHKGDITQYSNRQGLNSPCLPK